MSSVNSSRLNEIKKTSEIGQRTKQDSSSELKPVSKSPQNSAPKRLVLKAQEASNEPMSALKNDHSLEAFDDLHLQERNQTFRVLCSAPAKKTPKDLSKGQTSRESSKQEDYILEIRRPDPKSVTISDSKISNLKKSLESSVTVNRFSSDESTDLDNQLRQDRNYDLIRNLEQFGVVEPSSPSSSELKQISASDSFILRKMQEMEENLANTGGDPWSNLQSQNLPILNFDSPTQNDVSKKVAKSAGKPKRGLVSRRNNKMKGREGFILEMKKLCKEVQRV